MEKIANLKIYFGKNKTGKTQVLEKNDGYFYEELYIPSELNINEMLEKDNLGTKKKPNYTVQWKVINFINKIFTISERHRFNERNIELRDHQISIVNDFKQNFIENSKVDKYLESKIINAITVRQKTIEQDLVFEDLLGFNIEDKKWDIQSSGTKHYSLLSLIFKMLNDIKIPETTEKHKFILKIDEPEKFCHPELIIKIADIIFNISKKIRVEIVTHSNYFLEKIFRKHKNDSSINVDYIYCYSEEDELGRLFFDQKRLKLKKHLSNFNYREISLMIRILFSSNVILVEGLHDEEFVNSIWEEYFPEEYLTIIDCSGKKNMEKFIKTIKEINSLEKNIKICAFYDFDKDGKFEIDMNDITEIVQIENLEEELFQRCNKHHERKRCEICHQSFRDKHYDCFRTKQNNHVSKKFIDSSFQEVLKNSTRKNIVEIIEKKKEALIRWIKS